MKVLYIVSWFALFSCVYKPDFPVESQWSELQKVDPIQCQLWPTLESDLGYQDFQILNGRLPWFFVRGQNRTGGQSDYWAEFKSPQTLNSLQKISLRANTLVVGGTVHNGGGREIVTIERGRGGSTLQIRDPVGNVVLSQSEKWPVIVGEAQAFAASNGYWLVYKTAAKNVSLEDRPYQIGYFRSSSTDAKMFVQSVGKIEIAGRIKAFIDPSNGDLRLLWRTEAEIPEFFWQIFKMGGDSGKPLKLPFPVTVGLESWSAHVTSSEVFIAAVDGDSLVEQATLVIGQGKLNSMPSLSLEKLPLDNVRVSSPLWLEHHSRPYLLMPKWLDLERTIAVFEKYEGRWQPQVDIGVLRTGTTLLGSFFEREENATYVVTRSKANFGWRYELCQVNSL